MDPDPGGKNLKITTTTHAENLYRYIFILLSKFGPAPWFYTFGQSFLSFSTTENWQKVIFHKVY